jgi:hypothetical protein
LCLLSLKLGYQLFIHVCSGNYLGNIFLLFFLSFSDCFVKRPDGEVVLSGRPFSLFEQACLCDLLCGTTSERHLSSVRTVNPVGLYRIPPRRSPCYFILFWVFLSSCPFYECFSRALVLFAIYLQSRYVSLPFFYIILSFYA